MHGNFASVGRWIRCDGRLVGSRKDRSGGALGQVEVRHAMMPDGLQGGGSGSSRRIGDDSFDRDVGP